jgi:hypothetical protein
VLLWALYVARISALGAGGRFTIFCVRSDCGMVLRLEGELHWKIFLPACGWD